MKNLLDLLQSVSVLVFCALGSAAFLKYLLCPPQRPSRSQAAPRASKAAAGCPGAAPPQTRIEPAPARPPVPPPPPDIAPAQAEPAPPAPLYPQTPPRELPATPYEVANPGYKLSDGFCLQLRPSACGVLLAYSISSVTCVYIQPGLEDASVDLKRQGIGQLYDLYDRSGKPYQALPQGVLRLTNIQPALCRAYGENLALVTKGRLLAVPASDPV